MTGWKRVRSLLSLLIIILISLPLASLAQDPQKDEKKDEAKEKKEEGCRSRPTRRLSSPPTKARGCRWTFPPTARLSSSICLATSIRCRSRVVKQNESSVGSPSRASRFSPDGKQIVFISDRSGAENLWIADADGSNPKALTKGRNQCSCLLRGRLMAITSSLRKSPTQSARSRHGCITRTADPAFTSDRPSRRRRIPLLEAPRKRLANNFGAVASPDGRYIYYARHRSASLTTRSFRSGKSSGSIARPANRPITNAQGSAMRPVLSPDGKKLVYATRFEAGTALRVRDLETSEERWLINNVTRDDQESRGTRDLFPGYCFMPDGNSLIVPINGKIERVDLETGKATDLPSPQKSKPKSRRESTFENRVDDSAMVRARLIRWPAMSPDGKRVVFSSLNKLWIMPICLREHLRD